MYHDLRIRDIFPVVCLGSKEEKIMPAVFKYNIYGGDGRIIVANVQRSEISSILGFTEDYVGKQLSYLVRGQKVKIKEYTVECILDRSSSVPNTEAMKLLKAEWDEVCMPFRRLQLQNRHQSPSAFR